MSEIRCIALVSDFGSGSPYVGQTMLCLAHRAPNIHSVALISDLPPFRPDLAAYLLPAIARDVAYGTLFLCVVDPGVGGERAAIALEADGRWYLGPDNGLLSVVARRAARRRALRVNWRPPRLSDSFHGRDLFCPLAAMLAGGDLPELAALDIVSLAGGDWPHELSKVIYADGYGNLLTGVRASALGRDAKVHAAGREISHARTFCEVPRGEVFWYENSFGLVELAVNLGRATELLGLGPGDPIAFDLALIVPGP